MHSFWLSLSLSLCIYLCSFSPPLYSSLSIPPLRAFPPFSHLFSLVLSLHLQTVIMAVFENDKNAEVQLKCWNHWHARQPTIKQRVIDIGKNITLSR